MKTLGLIASLKMKADLSSVPKNNSCNNPKATDITATFPHCCINWEASGYYTKAGMSDSNNYSFSVDNRYNWGLVKPAADLYCLAVKQRNFPSMLTLLTTPTKITKGQIHFLQQSFGTDTERERVLLPFSSNPGHLQLLRPKPWFCLSCLFSSV